jgi:hypothetical protein
VQKTRGYITLVFFFISIFLSRSVPEYTGEKRQEEEEVGGGHV